MTTANGISAVRGLGDNPLYDALGSVTDAPLLRRKVDRSAANQLTLVSRCVLPKDVWLELWRNGYNDILFCKYCRIRRTAVQALLFVFLIFSRETA